MFDTATTQLMGFGSARRATRAVSRGDTMELNPLLFYDAAGVSADVLRTGAASRVTRAVGGGEEAELNPIYQWTPPGVQQG